MYKPKRIRSKRDFQNRQPVLHCGPGKVCREVSNEACCAIQAKLSTARHVERSSDHNVDQSTVVHPDKVDR